MTTTAYMTGPQTAPTSPVISTVRPTITGGGTTQWDLKDASGVSMRSNPPSGYNLGVFEYYSEDEATALIAQLYSEGVRLVRLVGFNRTFGSPGKFAGDSNRITSPPGTDAGLADSLWLQKNPRHWHKLDVYMNAIRALNAAHPTSPMWVILCMEGDIKQSGCQSTAWNGAYRPTSTNPDGTFDRSLTLPFATKDTIPGGLADWGLAGGLNVFTSPSMFQQVREEAKALVRRYRSCPFIFGYEFLSEPLPPSGTFDKNGPQPPNRPGAIPWYIYPGSAGDGVYDNTWSFAPGNPKAVAYLGTTSTGPGLGRMSIEEFYRTLIADTLPLDPGAIYIVGGRGGYNLDPEMREVIDALSDDHGPNALGGNLVAAGKIMGTWDMLGAGCNQCAKVPNRAWTASKMNCPVFQNQLGQRNSGDGNKDPGDASDWGLRNAVRTLKAWGFGTTVWDRRGNSSGGYGVEYQAGGDGDGANGTYTTITRRRDNLSLAFNDTYSAIYSAAVAAANAAHGVLVIVKDDFTNCYTSGGTVQLGIGSVTVGTTTFDQIRPITDPDSTNIVFNLGSGGSGIVIDYAWNDAPGSTYLPGKFPVMRFDNSTNKNNYLSGSIPFFGTTATGNTATGAEDFAAMMQATPTVNNTAMTLLHGGDSSTVTQWPNLKINSSLYMTGAVVAKNAGGTGVGTNPVGTNTQAYLLQAGVPITAAIIKGGASRTAASIKMFVNGIDDTGTVPVTVPPYASSASGETLAGTGNTYTNQTIGDGTSISVTRFRIGANGTGTNPGELIATSAGFCIFRGTPTDAQVWAVGKLLQWRAGGGHKEG